MTSQRRFFATKPTLIEYMTLELSHVACGAKRYVRNQFYDKTFAGKEYQAAAMEVMETIQDDRCSVNYEIQLGRVGSQVKQMVKTIDKYPLGWMIPIEATVTYYLSDNLDVPYRAPITLSVGNIAIKSDVVAITLDTANPRGVQVARRYNGNDFPGTKAKV